MQNPDYEKLGDGEDVQPSRVGGLMPKYHLVDGLKSTRVARWIESALPLADQLEDVIPTEVRERHNLVAVADAGRMGHRPDSQDDYERARRRMAFAELFELQTAFALMRSRFAAEPATPILYRKDAIEAFKKGLGVEQTNA